jgi:hypothetical protein
MVNPHMMMLTCRLAITKIMWAGVFPAWGVGGVLAWKRKQFMVDHVFAKFK